MLAASDYTTVVILVLTATVIGLGILIASRIVGPRRIGPAKHSTYESGMEPIGDTRRRFNVRFYLVAVLFLVFDVELLFFYPWAVLFPQVAGSAATEPSPVVQQATAAGYGAAHLLIGMGVFFALLLVGFVYEWRRGVFKWN